MNKLIISAIRFLFNLVGPLLGPSGCRVKTEDVLLEENFKLKIYTPHAAVPSKNVALYFHGGGWIIGSVKAYDRILKYICFNTGFTVVGVDYRKAPEFKYPKSTEDAITAYLWVIDNIIKGDNDPKIALIGDSAGGSIVTELSEIIKRKNYVVPNLNVLIYPAIGLPPNSLAILKKAKPKWLNLFGYLLLKYCLYQYYNNLNELKSVDNILSSFDTPHKTGDGAYNPKILILMAECDPLSKFIFKWKKEQLKLNKDQHIEYVTYLNTIHGFINFSSISKQARKALDDIVHALNNMI